MTKVLCFGNEFIGKDKLAKKILPELRKKLPEVEFIPSQDPFEIFSYQKRGEELLILDKANVPRVTLIDDLEKIKEIKSSTSHDLDLGFFLKLMKNLNRKVKIKIICLPQKGNKEEIVKEVKEILDIKKDNSSNFNPKSI